MDQKLIKCKTCGAEIAKTAKACPHCGAKNKVLHPVRGAIAGIIALLFCVVIISALAGNGDTSSDAKPTSQESSTVQSSAKKEETAIEISAFDLWAAYDENEVNADNLYGSKILSVTGSVTEIGKDIVTDTPYVLLKAGDTYGIYSVQCYFQNTMEADKLVSLKDGDTITLTGKCTGRTLNVILSNCSLIS